MSKMSAYLLWAMVCTNTWAAAEPVEWFKVDEGLFITSIAASGVLLNNRPKITVIKVDPNLYELTLLTASETADKNMTARQWAEKYKLLGTINAGMFLPDYSKNVGYMKNFQHFNNSRINNKYQSVAAFNPVDKSDKPFQIFDTDEQDMKDIIKRYHTVVQNLRLIKYPGENRWSQQLKKWSEAALGMDEQGHVLFIFSRAPFSMFDFNQVLINSGIGLVASQHLEGGPEASLYFSHAGKTIDSSGGFDNASSSIEGRNLQWNIPNVIGFKKHGTSSAEQP